MHTKNIEENIKKLGFGLMRLPRKDDEFDLDLLRDIIDLYLEKGFSYFDTSPFYGIVTVLSDMSTMEQMPDNVSYMENFLPLNNEERAVIETAKQKLEAVDTVGCTGCGYCLEGCPQQIRIPDLFRILNNQIIYADKGDAYHRYKNLTGRTPKASDCIACGCCEGACPQHLPVISLLERVVNTFEK